ncbi:MAG: hypothetical protein ACOCSF_07995 [Halanaeroarchaeum sp.]
MAGTYSRRVAFRDRKMRRLDGQATVIEDEQVTCVEDGQTIFIEDEQVTFFENGQTTFVEDEQVTCVEDDRSIVIEARRYGGGRRWGRNEGRHPVVISRTSPRWDRERDDNEIYSKQKLKVY